MSGAPFHLDYAQSEFERYMIDACALYEPLDVDTADLNPDTLELVLADDPAPIYAGRCLIKQEHSGVADRVEGEDPVVVLPTEIHIPLSAPAPSMVAVVVITDCVRNPHLIDRAYAVRYEREQTVQISRCLYVQAQRHRGARL